MRIHKILLAIGLVACFFSTSFASVSALAPVGENRVTAGGSDVNLIRGNEGGAPVTNLASVHCERCDVERMKQERLNDFTRFVGEGGAVAAPVEGNQ